MEKHKQAKWATDALSDEAGYVTGELTPAFESSC
jgi:hypothetical protein